MDQNLQTYSEETRVPGPNSPRP